MYTYISAIFVPESSLGTINDALRIRTLNLTIYKGKKSDEFEWMLKATFRNIPHFYDVILPGTGFLIESRWSQNLRGRLNFK